MSMSYFEIDPVEFHTYLTTQNITHLFHANTLITSTTYLKNREIMSRQYAENNDLWQTPQDSDELDKTFGVWDDIFLDSTDICSRSGLPNAYGPILFNLSSNIILDPAVSSVKITLRNPIYWQGLTDDQRYMTNENYQDLYTYGTFEHMITLQTNDGKISLIDYLNDVKIDGLNLNLTNPPIDTYSYCRGVMRYAIGPYGGYDFTFSNRRCGTTILQEYNRIGNDEMHKRFRSILL